MSDEHSILTRVRYEEHVDVAARLNAIIDQLNRLTQSHIDRDHNADYTSKLLTVAAAARHKRGLELKQTLTSIKADPATLNNADNALDLALIELDLHKEKP